jgi:hypothetical protein
MTDEEEFAARSQLKWTREGDAWILLCHFPEPRQSKYDYCLGPRSGLTRRSRSYVALKANV